MEAMLVWGLVLMGAAVGLLVIDLFVPTAGILIVVSASLAIAGVVCLFKYDTAWGISGTMAVLIGGPALFALGFKIMPHTPVGRKLILGASTQDEVPVPQESPLAKLVGSTAVVVTDLRPVGTIRIGSERFEAISETELVRSGTTVRITALDGLSLRVRPADQA